MSERPNARVLAPILAGFFVMSFCDIIGTVMNQVKAECAALTPVIGFAQGAMGASGILIVLLACLSYLLGLGVFANAKREGSR